MDHVVYLDAQAKELESLLSGGKSMIIRGATGRKLPHGRVDKGDTLYFINNNAEGMVRAKAKVKSAFHSEKMNEDESCALVMKNQTKLILTEKQMKRGVGKRYIVLIEVVDVKTGGATGIGLQMAKGLAEAGSNIVICSRRVEVCEEAAAQIEKIGVKRWPSAAMSPSLIRSKR